MAGGIVVKKVKVVSDEDELAGCLVKAAFVGGPLYLVYMFVSDNWEAVLAVVVLAFGGYLLYSEKRYRGRLEDRLGRRDARITPLEDEDGWEDELDRCIDEVNQLAQAGIQFDDIRRRLLLGEKFKREEALAALEEAQDRWPRASFFLFWREESIKRQTFPNHRHPPADFKNIGAMAPEPRLAAKSR